MEETIIQIIYVLQNIAFVFIQQFYFYKFLRNEKLKNYIGAYNFAHHNQLLTEMRRKLPTLSIIALWKQHYQLYTHTQILVPRPTMISTLNQCFFHYFR